MLTSRPIEEITSEQLRQRQKIGLEAIINAPDFTLDRGGGADGPFREALLRLKAQEGLYLEDERGVTFLTPDIFRASIPLPATAPPGNYDVEVDAVCRHRDPRPHAARISSWSRPASRSRSATSPATGRSLYGLATAAIALFFGWLANVIFRRD